MPRLLLRFGMMANAFVKDVQEALDAGMNAHIAKPIDMETLKNTLGSCIPAAGPQPGHGCGYLRHFWKTRYTCIK